MKNKKHAPEIQNRRAFHDYEVLETLDAGIVLQGGEVKSIRNGSASIKEAYCTVSGSTIYLVGSYIKLYENAGFIKYDENRDRVLLLRKKEIEHVRKFVEAKGCTAVPLKMFFNERGLCKVRIALCKGKHTYDKKAALAKRDVEMETKRQLNTYKS